MKILKLNLTRRKNLFQNERSQHLTATLGFVFALGLLLLGSGCESTSPDETATEEMNVAVANTGEAVDGAIEEVVASTGEAVTAVEAQAAAAEAKAAKLQAEKEAAEKKAAEEAAKLAEEARIQAEKARLAEEARSKAIEEARIKAEEEQRRLAALEAAKQAELEAAAKAKAEAEAKRMAAIQAERAALMKKMEDLKVLGTEGATSEVWSTALSGVSKDQLMKTLGAPAYTTPDINAWHYPDMVVSEDGETKSTLTVVFK